MDDRFIEGREKPKPVKPGKDYWVKGKGTYMARQSLYRMGCFYVPEKKCYRVNNLKEDHPLHAWVAGTPQIDMEEIK